MDDIRQAKINNRAGAARTTREDADLEQIIIETIGRRIHPKHGIGPTTWVEIILRDDRQFVNCYERERDERNKYS